MEPTAASCRATPRWNLDRPFLIGRFHQETKRISRFADAKSFSFNSLSSGPEKPIGCYDTAVQELIVIDHLLSALVGIEGRYVSIKRIRGQEDKVTFQVDASMDLALQEMAKRIFPLCESFLLIDQFVESRSQFKNGLVNHAFAAALRALLLDYQAMVAQLEHQFRLGRLSIQGLHDGVHASIVHCDTEGFSYPGDNSARSLLEKMAQCASNAYLGILERWIYEGAIDDPYGEFCIAENRSLQKESLTQDYDAKYWKQRYSLKNDIPSFLANIAGMILTTGKYLNVMQECGHSIQVPMSENSKLMTFGSNHHYLECVKAAYEFSSGELLNLIKEKYDLVGKLRFIKHYLLLDQRDFLVHFMDIAPEELMKRHDEISVEKLQSLLDLALCTTAAAADPCHEDLTCFVERSSLLRGLDTLKDLDIKTISDSSHPEEPLSITGLETFSLSYKGVRAFNTCGTAISRSSLLCRSMLRFINSLLHYLTFEVLEPNWHVMQSRLQTAKSIDEVIQYHDFFLDKCLRECLLRLPELLKRVEKLKSLCLQYAAAAQWLISSSFDVPKLEELSISSLGTEKSKQWKSRSLSQAQKLMTRNTTVTESILKFEREFNTELQSLGQILSSSSQAEPYLSHLARWILGVGYDQ